MTIGIALSGPRAGYGIFKALQSVETVGRGAVGGFVSFAVIAGTGELLRAETQGGGTSTLFAGCEPPPEFADAAQAVLMSSGPNRPEPLSQFTPGEPGVGLVTGHRLPNVAADGKRPPNLMVLDAMKLGGTAGEAVSDALKANAQADAGLIALAPSGEIAIGDTEFVSLRSDRASLVFSSDDGVLKGAVTHNSIFPVRGLCELVAGVAIDCYEAPDRCDRKLLIDRSVRLEPSACEKVHVDDHSRIVSVEVGHDRLVSGELEGALLLYETPVFREGALVGHISGEEPYTIVRGGRPVSFSGRRATEISLKT